MADGALLRIGLVILALLLLSSATLALLRLAYPARDWRDLANRVKAWWIMAPVVFGAVVAGERWALLFFGIVSVMAMREYLALIGRTERPPSAASSPEWVPSVDALALLSIPVQYYWIALGWYGMFVIFIPVYIFLVLPVRLVLSRNPAGFVARVSELQWGLLAFVFGVSHLAYLVHAPHLATTHPVAPAAGGLDGRGLVLFVIFVVEMSDVLQYVWGKTCGRHAVLPTISPGKTWEGFVGGALSATVLSLAIRFLTPFSVTETLAVSLLLTVTGFCGGAVMSAVKRDFGVKDFAHSIPGHGGVIDRIDSLCYAAPVFFHYVRYCYC